MEYIKNNKKDFIVGVNQRINNGKWGIEEISFLNENRLKYDLSFEDIGMMLVNIYKYTYTMAIEDGFISQLELDQLSQIQILSYTLPKNQLELEQLRVKINLLNTQYEKTNYVQEQMDLKSKYNIENKINSIYYSKYPKLTPYNTYN